MSKLSIQIGHIWLSTCLLLSLFFGSGCKPDSTPQSKSDSFAFTTPRNIPSKETADNNAASSEEDDSPPIPGYTTEKNRKDFLNLQFDYLEEGDPPPMIETPSGLKYRILEQGTGKQVTPDARISINFLANLENGRNYDSLLTHGKKGDIPEQFFSPVTYLLRDMIDGWQEGLVLLKEGGLIEMEIPPSLGFGEDGNPNRKVPPNARLFHMVRVLTVNAKMFKDLARDQIINENFKESDSQIFYKILKKTDGKRPSFTDIVTINYTVHRLDGMKLIDTYETGVPLRTPVIRLVSGMSEGVKMIGEGGSIDLILPPQKAFGRHSETDGVPDNTFVRVKIELLKVEPNNKLGLPKGDKGATDKGDTDSEEKVSKQKDGKEETTSQEQDAAESSTPEQPETESSAKADK